MYTQSDPSRLQSDDLFVDDDSCWANEENVKRQCWSWSDHSNDSQTLLQLAPKKWEFFILSGKTNGLNPTWMGIKLFKGSHDYLHLKIPNNHINYKVPVQRHKSTFESNLFRASIRTFLDIIYITITWVRHQIRCIQRSTHYLLKNGRSR